MHRVHDDGRVHAILREDGLDRLRGTIQGPSRESMASLAVFNDRERDAGTLRGEPLSLRPRRVGAVTHVKFVCVTVAARLDQQAVCL